MTRTFLVNNICIIHNLPHHVPSALGTESSCNQLEKDQGQEVRGDADDNEQFSSGNFYGSCHESGSDLHKEVLEGLTFLHHLALPRQALYPNQYQIPDSCKCMVCSPCSGN